VAISKWVLIFNKLLMISRISREGKAEVEFKRREIRRCMKFYKGQTIPVGRSYSRVALMPYLRLAHWRAVRMFQFFLSFDRARLRGRRDERPDREIPTAEHGGRYLRSGQALRPSNRIWPTRRQRMTMRIDDQFVSACERIAIISALTAPIADELYRT